MKAYRYEEEARPSIPARIDAGRRADNDNGDADVASVVPRPLLSRLGSRRDGIFAALLILSYGLTAYAWTHPRSVERPREVAPVTPTVLAALTPSVPAAAPSEPEIVVPDLPHMAARGSRSSHGANPEAARSSDPAGQIDAAAALAPATPSAPVAAPVAAPTARTAVTASAAQAEEAEEPAAEEPAAEEPAAEEPVAGPTAGDVDVAMERAVNDHEREVEACIESAPDEAQGQVAVRVVIAPDGSVRSTSPRGPAALRDVGRCLARAVRGWTIEVPNATAEVSTSWTFEVESNAE